jgi:LysR family cys regulon transcriptional activator
MNFQQLRSVREAVRSSFNLTEAAQTLHASQSGVSRQIRDLEQELGLELFIRSGKRLTGLTSSGNHLMPIIERVLAESRNLKEAGQAFLSRQQGLLSVATTHSQARYALPKAVQDFRGRFPGVKLHLHQGSPKQIAQMLGR